jgi:hypothetical protein
MAFPSNTGTVQQSLSEAWNRARQTATSIKSRSQGLRTKSEVSLSSGDILLYSASMANAKVTLQALAAVEGLAAYAQEQVDDNTINIVVEFNAMMAQIDATIAWVITNFPKDGSGFLLAQSLTAAGRTQDRSFNPAQTASLRTALDALIATIN